MAISNQPENMVQNSRRLYPLFRRKPTIPDKNQGIDCQGVAMPAPGFSPFQPTFGDLHH